MSTEIHNFRFNPINILDRFICQNKGLYHTEIDRLLIPDWNDIAGRFHEYNRKFFDCKQLFNKQWLSSSLTYCRWSVSIDRCL